MLITPQKDFQFSGHKQLKCKKKTVIYSLHCFIHDHFCRVGFYTTFFPQPSDQSVGVAHTHIEDSLMVGYEGYLQRVPSSYTINTKDRHQHNKASG